MTGLGWMTGESLTMGGPGVWIPGLRRGDGMGGGVMRKTGKPGGRANRGQMNVSLAKRSSDPGLKRSSDPGLPVYPQPETKKALER